MQQSPPLKKTTPPPQSYKGIRHARLTRSMKNLTPALKTVLFELRYRLCDHESAPISNHQLAQATGYSEGYISVLVRQLAGETVTIKQQNHPLRYPGVAQPFIARTWDAQRRHFIITMLPPPELRPVVPRQTSDAPRSSLQPAAQPEPSAPETPVIQLTLFDVTPLAGDHTPDPWSLAACDASEQPQTPQNQDQSHDPSYHIHDQTVCMQQHAPAEHDASAGMVNDPLPPPASFTLPEVWSQMLQGTPGYSHADYACDLAKAATRALREHPDHLICWSISRGQPVYSADELVARAHYKGQHHAERTGYPGDAGDRRGSPDRRSAGCRPVCPSPRRATPHQPAGSGRAAHGHDLAAPGRGPTLAELPRFLQSDQHTDSQPTSPRSAHASHPRADELPVFLRM